MTSQITAKINKIRATLNALPPKDLTFDKVYTDTLFDKYYPEEYDPNCESYTKIPFAYVSAFGKPRTHTHKGGIECGVCFEKKTASGLWFCRLCNMVLCGGCYQGCKRGGGSNFTPISTMDLSNKEYDMYNSRAEQPRCPTCRGEGSFGTKGVKATKIRKFVTNTNEEQYFGVNITTDLELKKGVKDYIDEFNEGLEYFRSHLTKVIKDLGSRVDSLEEDSKYQGFCDDKNEKEKLIRDMEQTIRQIRSDMYKIEKEKQDYVKEFIGDIDNEDNDVDTAITASNILSNHYPRKFMRETIQIGGSHIEFCNSDRQISRFSNFTDTHKFVGYNSSLRYGWSSYYNHNNIEMPDIIKGLEKAYQLVTERFDYLTTGCILPKLEVYCADKLTDNDLDLQIAQLLAIQKKRRGGATKDE